jgi:hypothetical protein
MPCVTAIRRRRWSGELDRRAHDRRDDHSYPPVANMRFPWYRDARRITELTATDNIIALIARS